MFWICGDYTYPSELTTTERTYLKDYMDGGGNVVLWIKADSYFYSIDSGNYQLNYIGFNRTGGFNYTIRRLHELPDDERHRADVTDPQRPRRRPLQLLHLECDFAVQLLRLGYPGLSLLPVQTYGQPGPMTARAGGAATSRRCTATSTAQSKAATMSGWASVTTRRPPYFNNSAGTRVNWIKNLIDAIDPAQLP